jgi:hypothetical protein
MPAFKTIKELIRGLQNGDKLLIDMFNKRKTVAIKYDDALETLDNDENKLRYLISHGVIIQTDDTLELDDNYLHFFENVLEVNEEINVASVKQYVDKLRLNIDSYLAADTEKRKGSFMRDIRHTFHSIAQMTRRNIIDLKRNMEDTYKQEPNFKLKKLRLVDFDKKCVDIAELIRQTEKIMDEQTIFFSSAMDVLLRQTISDVRSGLRESSHSLIDIQKQIVDYLNRIEYQSRLVKKIRQLKYLKDQFMLEENTNVKSVLGERNPVWMEPVVRFTTKVSIDFLRNDDAALSILADVRRQLSKKTLIRQRLLGKIDHEYLDAGTETMRVFNHQEIFNMFNAQSNDLFNFVRLYDFKSDTTREERLVLFLQLASQYPDEIRFTDETRISQNIEYPIILPL